MDWTKNEIVEATVEFFGQPIGHPVTFRITAVLPDKVVAMPWMREDLQEKASQFLQVFGKSMEKDAQRNFDPKTGKQMAPFSMIGLEFTIHKVVEP